MSGGPKRGRGRPRLNPDRTRGVMFSVRLSESERAALTVAARAAGVVSASEWARLVLLEAARPNMRNHGGTSPEE